MPEPPKAEVPAGWEWVWRAWHRLSQDRPWLPGGMGAPSPQRIPWAAVVAWCDFYDLPGDAVDVLDRCLGEMDAEYMDYLRTRPKS